LKGSSNSTTSPSGFLACYYGNYNDSELFFALTFDLGTESFTFITGNVRPTNPMNYGITGIIVMMFFAIAMVTTAFFHPAVPIIMSLFALMIGIVLGLIVVSTVAFMSLVLVGAIIIYKMRD
jgi:hypothetical protein